MNKVLPDVQGEPSTPPNPVTPPVDGDKGGGDDKDKNFAALRKQIEERDAEIARLKTLAEGKKDDDDRTLVPDAKKDDTEGAREKAAKKVLFERDMKEATRQWNSKNKVTTEEWASIKKAVQLTGDETQSEIMEKIDKEYQALPTVRERREKELIAKGRREALQQFSDDELDLGTGGDIDLGGSTEPKVNNQERAFLRNVAGISKKEDLAKINKESDPNQWSTGPNPTRKFFQP